MHVETVNFHSTKVCFDKNNKKINVLSFFSMSTWKIQEFG